MSKKKERKKEKKLSVASVMRYVRKGKKVYNWPFLIKTLLLLPLHYVAVLKIQQT